MHHNFKLVADMRSLFTNETLYRRKVKKFIYLTHIRPGISVVVSIISRFLNPPQEAHNMAIVD
jgi:NADH:ubiquinone oxidoreductase subunit H